MSVPRGQYINTPYQLPNGSLYAGEWKVSFIIIQERNIHGRGLYLLPDKTLMYCITDDNTITGKGRVIYPNGDYYEGDIDKGVANGRGKYV